MGMCEPTGLRMTGPFETRFSTLLGALTSVRPCLIRYFARMTGPNLDGEDVCAFPGVRASS
jgi:hypothetical protein